MTVSTIHFRFVARLAVITGFACFALSAHATDTYDPATRQLSIPSVSLGAATFTNAVVTVGSILSPPSGTSPDSSQDSYNPVNRQLTVPAVTLGGNNYYNAVVGVTGLVSVGSVLGADTYNGSELTIASVQVGSTVYAGVVVTVGGIVSAGGGMPNAATDSYDPSSGQLTIAAVQVGGRVYTNPIITVGSVKSVASSYPATPSADLQAVMVGYASLVAATELADLAGISGGAAPCLSGSTSLDATTSVVGYSGCTTTYTPGSIFNGTLTTTSAASVPFGELLVSPSASIEINSTGPVNAAFSVAADSYTDISLSESLTGTTINGLASLSTLTLQAGSTSTYAASDYAVHFTRTLENGVVTTGIPLAVTTSLTFNNKSIYSVEVMGAVSWQGTGYPTTGSLEVLNVPASLDVIIQFLDNGQFTYRDPFVGTTITKNWTDADVQAALAYVTQ